MAQREILPANERRFQSPLEECCESLGEAHDESVYGARKTLLGLLPRFATWPIHAGEQVGFTVHDLIRMLKSGMSLEFLLELIELGMSGAWATLNRVQRKAVGGVYAHSFVSG
jgi:hypothetical protein